MAAVAAVVMAFIICSAPEAIWFRVWVTAAVGSNLPYRTLPWTHRPLEGGFDVLFDPNSIREVCWNADDRLWEAFARSEQISDQDPTVSQLIFPTYSGNRAGQLRVSEQEARFAFAEALQKSRSFYYSVETPTREAYQLTGSSALSAQTDLTLYNKERKPVLNVEFKAKGASRSARSQFSIRKDVEKLVREPSPGLWFHLLESVDNGTITKLLDVLTEAFPEVLRTVPPDAGAKPIIFHLCILKHGFSIHKTLDVGPSSTDTEELRRQFSFAYLVSRTALLNITDANGWVVHWRQK